MPILALRNMVIYPGVLLPVAVARPKSLKLIRHAHENDGLIGVCTQIDKNDEDPNVSQLYQMGTVAQVVRILEMPDNSTTVILEGKKRFRLGDQVAVRPYLKAKVFPIPNAKMPDITDGVFPALISSIKDLATNIINNSGMLPPETSFAIRNIESPEFLINYACANFGFSVSDKMRLLEIDDLMERGYQLLELLNKESQLLELKMSIQNKAREGIDQQQREYFLQQQMKTIQNELGGSSPEQDVEEFRTRAAKKKWNAATAKVFDKELKKLERTSQHSPDYSIQLNYIETMLELPWNEYSNDNFNLKNAKKVLDADHFGLETVKDRILEHLAVLKLKTIQNELGGSSPEQDVEEFRTRASKKKWNAATAKVFEKELKKLERTSQHSPDYSIQLNYIETMLELPWNEYSNDNFNLKNAKKVLDADHFGLETVKDRILEHLAVLKLKGDMKSPIICL